MSKHSHHFVPADEFARRPGDETRGLSSWNIEYARGYADGRAADGMPSRELIALHTRNQRKAREELRDPPYLCGWLFAVGPAVSRAYREVLAPKRARPEPDTSAWDALFGGTEPFDAAPDLTAYARSTAGMGK